ncbi:helix-turn-helix transcriptional regulator [Rhodococcus opacus]|uniref:helix-turn-helix domain-containing protein n=1 Tax=Rhodococcus opacus TaxID=37919 RepID=UPI00146D20A6|nr:helix-turn-helix transcriptional regulator [Rhodococcus opacus]
MTKKLGCRWHLRNVMAEHDMFATTDLVPLLAERGVHLSREQVYRLVAKTPQRLSLETLAALCDIFDVGVEDLIEVAVTEEPVHKKAPGSHAAAPPPPVRRNTIRLPRRL